MPSEEINKPQDGKCLGTNPSTGSAKALLGRVLKTSRSGEPGFWGSPVWFEVPKHS